MVGPPLVMPMPIVSLHVDDAELEALIARNHKLIERASQAVRHTRLAVLRSQAALAEAEGSCLPEEMTLIDPRGHKEGRPS